MSNSFPPKAAAVLLAACHRRCCICHRFCGSKMELDHMLPRAEGGKDMIDNAIAVCFECHAEIHSYNTDHPRGRKFTEGELRIHKEHWLLFCKDNPGALSQGTGDTYVGPLQGMIDELEYNQIVCDYREAGGVGALFLVDQHLRANQTGAMSVLPAEVKSPILQAYRDMNRVNAYILKATTYFHSLSSNGQPQTLQKDAENGIDAIREKVYAARKTLVDFLTPSS